MLKKLYKISQYVVNAEKQKGLVSISIVNDRIIRMLNKKYRKLDKATDVLSFFMGDNNILGDIIVSEETAKRSARRYKNNLDSEMKRLVIHGTLHLLGYDHAKRSDRIVMRAKEDHYAAKIL